MVLRIGDESIKIKCSGCDAIGVSIKCRVPIMVEHEFLGKDA